MRYTTLIAALLLSSTALAAEPAAVPAAPEPPPIPERVKSGEVLEPEVTIIQRKDATVQEYRVNGQLYMVKIIPSHGYPYYLVDTDGDGSLDVRRDDLSSDVAPPKWVLFRW